MLHRMKTPRLILPALLLAALPIEQARAGLAVDNNAAFPESPDIVGATPAQADHPVRIDVAKKPRSNNRADISVGQSFAPGKTIKLDKIFIEYVEAVDGQPIRLNIHTIESIDGSTYKKGKNLLSKDAAYTFSADKGDVSPDERVLGLDFTGDDEITLEQGKVYIFEISTGNDDGTIDFRWTRTGSNDPVKSEGNAYVDREIVAFKTNNLCDFSFALVASKD